MSDEMRERVDRAIAEKVFPGCCIGIVRKDGVRDVFSFGRLTYENDSPEVVENTIYDLASVTKSIPVASLAALFIGSRRLSLRQKVRDYVPELQNDFGATIEDLLRYRVHGPRMSSLKYETFEQIRTHIFEKGFVAPPGESEYTNLPAFLLGIVLERVGGEILPALAHKYFFGPLAMNETTFFPHDVSRVAPTEIVDLPAQAGGVEIRGIVHDESARVFAQERRAVGHAGLFSTVPDLLNFLEALLRSSDKGFPFIWVIEAAEKGLGWQLEGDFLGRVDQGESLVNRLRFGKTGFTGTSVLVDRQKETALVILSNRTYPKRPTDQSAINSFRADIAGIAFA